MDCPSIKRALEAVYQTYLPRGTFPFVYLSLTLAPRTVDVNVHPTKREVHFLHEDEIVECIQRAVETRLSRANASRTFYAQTLLPIGSLASGSAAPERAVEPPPVGNAPAPLLASAHAPPPAARPHRPSAPLSVGQRPTVPRPVSSRADYHLVRTDSRLRTLDAYLQPHGTRTTQPLLASDDDQAAMESSARRGEGPSSSDTSVASSAPTDDVANSGGSPTELRVASASKYSRAAVRACMRAPHTSLTGWRPQAAAVRADRRTDAITAMRSG